VEERLARAAQTAARLAERAGDGERYADVGEYDPVLWSHCRLDEKGKMATDEHR